MLATNSNPSLNLALIKKDIKNAALKTGVDFNYLLAEATIESNLNPLAKSKTSSASGLFQCTENTWLQEIKDHGRQHGVLTKLIETIETDEKGDLFIADGAVRQKILSLRSDPALSAAISGEYTKCNKAYLERQLTRPINNTDLYIAHFLGAAGASRFLGTLNNNPNTAAKEIFPQIVKANKKLFQTENGDGISIIGLYERLSNKMANAMKSMPKYDKLEGQPVLHYQKEAGHCRPPILHDQKEACSPLTNLANNLFTSPKTWELQLATLAKYSKINSTSWALARAAFAIL